MRKLLFALLLVAPTFLLAQPPAGYYDSAQGLSGNSLRVALHDIIDNHTVLNYNLLWNYFAQTDKRTGTSDQVWDMYSDIPGGTPPYQYFFNIDQCGEYNSEGDCFNREHSFPKDWFGDLAPMNSDLHHLYPTDGWVNNKRGNFPYGEVGSADWTGQNGSKTGMNVTQGYNGTVFEPRDEFKGDFARTYFYMLTRYWGQTGSWSSPMLVNGDFSQWAEAMLLDWNTNDPVSTKETDRNNAVYNFQNNRNPYIDNPQWVSAIWGPVAAITEEQLDQARVWLNNEILIVDLRTEAAQGTIDVLDATGRTIATERLTGMRTSLELKANSGLYFAVIRVGDAKTVKRFVF